MNQQIVLDYGIPCVNRVYAVAARKRRVDICPSDHNIIAHNTCDTLAARDKGSQRVLYKDIPSDNATRSQLKAVRGSASDHVIPYDNIGVV